MEKIKNGIISVGELDTDFLVEGEMTLPPLVLQDTIRFAYNQYKKPQRGSDCTLFGPMGALSDLVNIEFTDEDIEEIRALAKTRGKVDNKGRYTQMGVKVVCDWWNSKNNNKVLFFRIDTLSDNFIDLIKKNYTVITTFKGNSKYTKDKSDDGIVNGVEFGKLTRGHCTRLVWESGVKVIDSFKGQKRNEYRLENIRGLVDNGVFYPSAYVILPEENVKISKHDLKGLTEFRNLIKQNIENNSKQRHITTSEQYKERLHETNNIYRSKLQDIEEELKKI